jgi:YegS/Rv2252/BmrU family lipid kinase
LGEEIRKRIVKDKEEHQRPFEISQTTGKEQLHEVVKNAIDQGFERFVAVGGDGTVSGVASGLVSTGLPLVILPAGTVNALARELGIPIGLDNGADWWLEECETRKLDVMQVGDRYYLMNISVGVSAEITKDVERKEINRLGVLAFLRRAMQNRKNLPMYKFQVTIDDTLTYIRASELMIANSGILLGWKALQLDPNAKLDDARMSVCYARLRTWFDYVRTALKVIFSGSKEESKLDCIPALREVRVHSNQRIPVQGDGDKAGMTPVTITLVPRALNVLAPVRQEGD